MRGDEVDYLSYPIIVVNPDQNALSWLAELEKDFLFRVVSEVQEYVRVLADPKGIAAIVLDQVEQCEEFLVLLKGQQIKTFVLLSTDQIHHFKTLTSGTLPYHPLFNPCHPEILRMEFARSIEQHVYKRERDLLLSVHRQENWFSLIGQLHREWAHEIRNRAAIISLNAEISMTRGQRQKPASVNSAATMEKIIEQCLNISNILDSLRELTNKDEDDSFISLTEVMEQVTFLTKLEALQIRVEDRAANELFLSMSEGTRLRSALVSILKYYGWIRNGAAPVLILIEERQGLYLKICDDLCESIPCDPDYTDGSLQCLVSIEPKLLDFAIGIRLLKSFGGEVSIEESDSETALVINLPVDLKQRAPFNE